MATLGTVGEKALVNEIVKNSHSRVALGPGDDAAAIKIGDKCIVVSSDISAGSQRQLITAMWLPWVLLQSAYSYHCSWKGIWKFHVSEK